MKKWYSSSHTRDVDTDSDTQFLKADIHHSGIHYALPPDDISKTIRKRKPGVVEFNESCVTKES